MIDLFSLTKQTNAYKIIGGDKRSGRLSHAYLLINQDGDNLLDYLKVFAKIIMCDSVEPCFTCRACSLIEKGSYPDVIFYGLNGDVTADDISSLIEESFVKPLENTKKLFVINHAENMSAIVQNKLLKTLEEPPKNVYILIGATGEYAFLPTVLSRVRKLEMTAFNEITLYNALINEYTDGERLKLAINSGDGTLGRAISLYNEDNTETIEKCIDIICNMQSSKDVLKYSNQLAGKIDFNGVLNGLELLFIDMLRGYLGEQKLIRNLTAYTKTKNAKGYNLASVTYALESVKEANKRIKANTNATMVTEWLLFKILEGKYKCQK